MQKKIFTVVLVVLFALLVCLIFVLFGEDETTSEPVEKEPPSEVAAVIDSSAKMKVVEKLAPLPEEPRDTLRLEAVAEPVAAAKVKVVRKAKKASRVRRRKRARRVRKARSTPRLAQPGQESTQQDKDMVPKEEQIQVTMLSPARVKKDVERCAAISRKIEETRNLTTEIDNQIISLLQHTEITREVEWIPEISDLLFALRTDRMALEQEVALITNEMVPWSRKGGTQSP